MLRALLLFLALPLNAQLLVNTYAGGVIRTGVPANSVPLGILSGVAWDPSGNIVFCDTTYNVIRRVDTTGMIETIAGTGVTGFGGDGGPATSALINRPTSPVYDSSGNLYFFDSDNYRIRRVDTNGVITTIAGDSQIFITGEATEGPATSLSLSNGLLFKVDPSGNLYLADEESGVVRVLTGGNFNVLAQISAPTGLVVDKADNVYVSSMSSSGGSVLQISSAGVVSTFLTFSPAVSDGSAFPNYVYLTSIDAAGNLYLELNGEVMRYAPDGTPTTITNLGYSGALFQADALGNLAIQAQQMLDVYDLIPVIQEFSNQSVLTTLAGANPQPAPDGTPLSQAWFLGPLSIAFSHSGDLFVAEDQACLIRKISAAGVLSTFAGTGTCGYPAPSGTASTANLVFPNNIAIDSQDNVWVADDFLNLYSISQQGVLSSIIKTPVSGGTGYLAVDAENRIAVLSTFALARVLPGGAYQTIIAPPSAGTLSGIGADSAGNVYFGSTGPPTQNVYVINNDATTTLKYPGLAAGPITFDPSGNIWSGLTTDNASGIATLGYPQSGFSGDGGPIQSARVAVSSTAFGPDGNLYFADGNRIRRVTGSGPSSPPVISQGGIVNAVSYVGGSVAPGELISIFGSNFGVSALQVTTAVNNALPFTVGRTKVLFNGTPGAITAITPTQINVFVPYEATSPVSIQVQVDNVLSAAVSVPLVATAPGLSSPILDQDGTLNSPANPAARGSIVSFFGTGLGVMSPQLYDGYLAISTPYSSPVTPPTITIGGQSASIQYAGDAPTLPTGVFQINATIPTSINTGPAAVAVGSSNQVIVFVK